MTMGRWLDRLVKRDGEGESEGAPVEQPEPAPEHEPEAQPPPRPEAVVNERSARALLASGTPPLPPEPARPPDRRPEPRPTQRDPRAAEPREWNIWDLERAARAADDQERQEERSALLIHLREFANADGDLPVEFDALVRESFAGVLEREPEGAAT
jgi:hypothetical protein